MKNKRSVTIFSLVMLIAIVISGLTFAVWSWTSDRGNDTNVSFNVTSVNVSCSANGGGPITEADIKLVPSSCTNSEYAIKREITTNVVNEGGGTVPVYLWLDINKLSQGLSDSHNFRYVLTTSPDSCEEGNIMSYGTFHGKSATQKVDILQNDKYSTSGTKTYYLYIWLDYNGLDRTSQDEEFEFELNGQCYNGGPSNTERTLYQPYVYNTGLIPVRLSESGDEVYTIEDDNPNWYNYGEKKWANAILVKENGTKTREYYKNYPGTKVALEDILAYYVWIPRYSYQVWAYTGTDEAGNPREIPIKFVDVNTVENATKIGDWYTHPAFWWDNDSDGIREEGEELPGIWVGKFEVSHETLSNSSTANSLGTDSGVICNQLYCSRYDGIRILPNVKSLRYNRLSNFFWAAWYMNYSGGTFPVNPFGLVKSVVDSHMIKNSEWGAVLYLSHSQYGVNGKVRYNNYTGFLMGCGAISDSTTSESSTCDNQYGTQTIYPQSTTGNVTGLFDMSGGSNEYVMGHYGATSLYSSSGFSSTYPLPASKYYNNYSTSQFTGSSLNNVNFCTLATCGGHALNEMYSWYGVAMTFIYYSYPWFLRSGYYGHDSIANAHYSSFTQGGSSSLNSSRFVLIPVRGIQS